LQKKLSGVADGKAQGADIICFPELATCGYSAKDFLDFYNFYYGI
jgi:NAD+ synthase (glutamine-hydrolysing)